MRLRTALLLSALLGLASLGWLRAAADGPPTEPTFAKDGVAFLTKHCIHCHGAKTQRAELSLQEFRSEEAVVKNRKIFQNVLKMIQAGEMPPEKRPRPTAQEIAAFSKTVTTAIARAESSGKRDPGRVTIRRLNRAEYNNTIRDLIGVDFHPAEDFPSDDVGHGFDNIGDVLSLSPVLLERYLAAAENIMRAAITVDPHKPTRRHMSARFMEPAVAKWDDKVRFRGVHTRGQLLHTPFNLNLEGEYKVRVRAYGLAGDKEPLRIALLANGKELKTFDLTATEKTPAVYEVLAPLEQGNQRFAVSLLSDVKEAPKSDKPQPKPGLYVEYLEVEGPMDTRPLSHRRLLACASGASQVEQTREVLTRFANRAYRRPATAEEVQRLVKLAEVVQAGGQKWEAGIQLAMQAVLVSPKFLFRVELDDRPTSAEVHPINDYQLASRLSYFLWSSMPDEELFRLAGQGQLTANLEAQVRRMLKDPRSRALTENFAMQWLQIRSLKTFAPDPALFPSFDEPLRSAMLGETEHFVDYVVREDRPILDLVDANYTFLNERLARHYNIVDTSGNRGGKPRKGPQGNQIRGPAFVRVELADGERGGVLTHASVLAVTSNPTRTSPVKRGRFVLDQILGTPPPPPPPNVPELEDKRMLKGSLRQRMEQHRANPSCANCHARMDPIGFAFENFNAIGAFRDKDGDAAIDPSGVLPDGGSFKGPADLRTLLRNKKELFSRCLTEKLLVYALGRGLDYYDTATVDGIVAALGRNDYKFSTLVLEITRSDPFRLRRGKEGPK